MHLSIMVNKQVWMDCFGAGVPTEEVLSDDIRLLRERIKRLRDSSQNSKQQSCSRLCNTLQRHQKMLAAVKDGQPWAWMLYPSEETDICH